MRPATITILGGLNGLIATMLAAAGSHALPATLSQADKDMFGLAAQFHLIVSVAILATAGLLASGAPQKSTSTSAILFQVGILAFCGSLYIRALQGPGSLGSFHWITPLGGLALMAAWGALVLAGVRWLADK